MRSVNVAELKNQLSKYLTFARGGEEIVIEKEAEPPVVLRALEPRGRLLSESIALAKKHAEELGYEPRMDPEFAADLEEIIRSRKPRDTSAWD